MFSGKVVVFEKVVVFRKRSCIRVKVVVFG